MCPMDQHNKSEEWHITYHFVWGPTRSKPCLIGEIARRLHDLIEEKAREEDFQPVTLLILPDRVYLAAEAPPSVAPHSIVCQVKSYTSRMLRDEFPELTRIPSLWTRAYFVMAGDAVKAEEALRRFEAAQPERRPRGRPRKTQASPPGDAANGPVEL